ncbi:MAG TPA: hypothetical protein VN026_04330 [Bacteroidia bacterium]|jgi:hypothetical protein|nr:hypothetical protein [Bacteroidia bacterium]
MSKSISIIFGEPKHGWLPVGFRYDDFNIEFSASDVLNNPMEELYNAIKNKTGQVTWWLEPFTYFFSFDNAGQDYILTISEADDIDGK